MDIEVIRLIKETAQKEVKQASSLKELDDIFRKYLGKERGEISKVLRSLKSLSLEKRRKIGKEANEINKVLRQEIFEREESLIKEKKEEFFDATVPGKPLSIGHLHPITLTLRKSLEIFQGMGFLVADGPEAESEWYNFDALNIPKDHPVRDAWDTFWLKDVRANTKGGDKLVLRTHTSPIQIRFMEKNNPPFRIIAPGRVFRREATDASHNFDFWQLEGLMIDKGINLSHFKGILQEFFNKFFKENIQMRLRPSFFPFTEPSVEVDFKRKNAQKWLEFMGAGMVHPAVLRNSGLDPREWQGFAFGFGLDRLTMIRYQIKDIRLFKSSDLRFLNQF